MCDQMGQGLGLLFRKILKIVDVWMDDGGDMDGKEVEIMVLKQLVYREMKVEGWMEVGIVWCFGSGLEIVGEVNFVFFILEVDGVGFVILRGLLR